jgi:hypothetical protein
MNTNSELQTTNNKPNEKKDDMKTAAGSHLEKIQKNFALA